MKNKAVFLVGVFDDCGYRKGGDFLSPESLALIEEIESENNIEAHIVFAITHRKFAGREKQVKLEHIRAERDRVVKEINGVAPDYIFCLGRTALACAYGRGSLTLDAFRREGHRVDDLTGELFVLDGLSRVRAQSGIRKWLKLDAHAALNGLSGTEWGDYTLMLPPALISLDYIGELMQRYPNLQFSSNWDKCPAGYEVESWAPGDMVGFDLETFQGLDPWQEGSRIRMAMISRTPGEATIIQLPPDSSMPMWLEDILADPDIIKAGSNIAFDYKWCQRFGIEVNNLWDTSVAEHILDENDPNTGLKYLTLRYLPRLGDYSREHRNLVKERGGWEFVRDDEQYNYAAADAEASVAAGLAQRAAIESDGLTVPHRLARKLYPILAAMQSRGTAIDPEVLRNLDTFYTAHLSGLRGQICDVLGPINPASPPQLATALVAAVPGIKLSKRILTQWWQGRYGDEADEVSTQKSILERESDKHEIIAVVLEFRKWSKMYGTYIKGVLDKHLVRHGGKYLVHPSFNQNRVETHRLSSSNPNLQNIPREPGEDDPPELNVKKMFCSRFEGGSIMEADFSQVELRVAAELSGDEAMTQAFMDGEDIHDKTTLSVWDSVTKERRNKAKIINFGIIYGMGSNALAGATKSSPAEAKVYKEKYFAAYPRLEQHIEEVHEQVKQDLCITSPFGFRRHFVLPPEKTTGDRDRWNQYDAFRVMRQAYNMLVQNTAACITFVSIVEVDKRMKREGLRSVLFGTVHDSILADIYPGEESMMARIFKEVMESPPTEEYGVTLNVPMKADIELGKTWGDKKEFKC